MKLSTQAMPGVGVLSTEFGLVVLETISCCRQGVSNLRNVELGCCPVSPFRICDTYILKMHGLGHICSPGGDLRHVPLLMRGDSLWKWSHQARPNLYSVRNLVLKQTPVHVTICLA